MTVSRFVCVHNRNRDGYEVPLALAEAGLLEALVTDWYAPSWLAWLPGLPSRRHRPGLPASQTRSVWRAFAGQVLGAGLRRDMARVFPVTDAILARAAARLARRHNAGLLAYGSYVPARELAARLPVIDFEYHPDPLATLAILAEDAARFPEVAQSFAREQADAKRVAIDQPWRRADRVICASTMTRRSLESAGCDPAIVDVVPYGFGAPREVAPRQPGACKLLFVGQGVQRKGLHHLIRAWQRRPRPGAILTLVCYEIDPGIAALIEDASILLLGRQSRDRLDALYRASDAFVMPSLVEGFGLVYLEALSHGCHVIGTGNTGLPDLGLSPAAVTIAEAGNLDALDAALTALARRKASGALDPRAIAAETAGWTWADFRRGIAAIAARELAAWNAR